MGRRSAFTIIELIVVIAVIVVLLAMLLPSLSSVRERSRSTYCLSNLRQLGIGTASYQTDYKGWFPSPVTTVSESSCWYTALDKYMSALKPDDKTRSGVAGQRAYRKNKECFVWQGFSNEPAKPPVNTSQTVKEFSRTLKMNSHLRRVGQYFAYFEDIKRPAEHVLFGDGTSIDLIAWPKNTFETGQFSMDINDKSEAGVGVRHGGGANIGFVDGHAEAYKLTSYQRSVSTSGIKVDAWQSEFVNAAGNLVYGNAIDGTKTMEAQNLRRNANMPLIWSIPGRLYRP